MKRIVWPLLSLLIMAAIFWFSSQDAVASQMQSGLFSQLLFFLPEDTASFLVRKAAHFTIYFVLGICVFNSCRAWHIPFEVVVTTVVCVLYAASDEGHQTFISGRSGQISDILLDGTASFLSACLLTAVYKNKQTR